jgi:hypothetical protein
MKKMNRGALKLSIETLRHLALEHVTGGRETDPPLPSGCRAGCLTKLPTTDSSISKL